jgi:hypothetical protein
MKKSLFICFGAMMAVSAMAQTTVTYKMNGLIQGDSRTLTKFEYVDKGEKGANQVWDYSGAKETGTMVLNQNVNYGQPMGNLNVASSNLLFACDEGGEKDTYFEISKDAKMYWGLQSKSAKIEFNEPIVDLPFPFSYGDIRTGSMDGVYTENTGETYPIEGHYFTSADAWGTLTLPDGTTYNDVLRVKVEKIYKQQFGSYNYDIHTIRYQYFAPGVRYPVMIALINDTQSDCNCSCGKSHTEEAFYQTQTALKSLKSFEMDSYMADAQGEFELSAYPNPFKTVVNAKLNAPKAATVKLEILDATGRLIQSYGEYNLEAGDNVVTLNTASIGIGQFTLRAIYGGEVFTQTIIKK